MPPKLLITAPAGQDHVKVAVRVRPFLLREQEINSRLIIEMQANTTTVLDPTGRNPPKMFTFDFSYWSFDGFTVDVDGLCKPNHSGTNTYADQLKIFSDLGADVVANALLGYNAALFAYGQTGSGKSYSMLGYGANKGIVPLTFDALFAAIIQNTHSTKQFQVTFSMLEIYNEKVRDLLVPTAQSPKEGLKVRQHAKKGFFVENLKCVPVSSYTEIEQWMAQGNILRTTAATKMNETSSRSHMIISLNFKQVFMNDAKQSTTKSSDIHLVDLAGSERAHQTVLFG